jgi:hypothetical protein
MTTSTIGDSGTTPLLAVLVAMLGGGAILGGLFALLLATV